MSLEDLLGQVCVKLRAGCGGCGCLESLRVWWRKEGARPDLTRYKGSCGAKPPPNSAMMTELSPATHKKAREALSIAIVVSRSCKSQDKRISRCRMMSDRQRVMQLMIVAGHESSRRTPPRDPSISAWPASCLTCARLFVNRRPPTSA
jgi:hypothetical protein